MATFLPSNQSQHQHKNFFSKKNQSLPSMLQVLQMTVYRKKLAWHSIFQGKSVSQKLAFIFVKTKNWVWDTAPPRGPRVHHFHSYIDGPCILCCYVENMHIMKQNFTFQYWNCQQSKLGYYRIQAVYRTLKLIDGIDLVNVIFVTKRRKFCELPQIWLW